MTWPHSRSSPMDLHCNWACAFGVEKVSKVPRKDTVSFHLSIPQAEWSWGEPSLSLHMTKWNSWQPVAKERILWTDGRFSMLRNYKEEFPYFVFQGECGKKPSIQGNSPLVQWLRPRAPNAEGLVRDLGPTCLNWRTPVLPLKILHAAMKSQDPTVKYIYIF